MQCSVLSQSMELFLEALKKKGGGGGGWGWCCGVCRL